MILYGYWRSSASWRVRLGMHLKGITFENVPVHLRDGVQRSEVHLARNPMGQVPVLALPDGTIVTQSAAILEYLDELIPEPALLPGDARHRLHIRQMCQIINSGIHPLQNLSVLVEMSRLGADRMAWGRQVIETGFHALEALVQESQGPYCSGNEPTMADLFLVPQMYNARRFGVDLTAFPHLVAVDAACSQLPAFIAAHPDQQPDANS